MSKKVTPHEEIEIGPTSSRGHAPFRRYVDGQLVETGVGSRRFDTTMDGACVEFGPRKENGRRDVRQRFALNAPGSTAHSGANSREYRDGWDRIFAAKREGPAWKAN